MDGKEHLIIGVDLTLVTSSRLGFVQWLVILFNLLDKNVKTYSCLLVFFSVSFMHKCVFYVVALASGSRFKARVLSIPPPPPLQSSTTSLGASPLSSSNGRTKVETDIVISEPDTSSVERDTTIGKI